jgi:hypothetical protein
LSSSNPGNVLLYFVHTGELGSKLVATTEWRISSWWVAGSNPAGIAETSKLEYLQALPGKELVRRWPVLWIDEMPDKHRLRRLMPTQITGKNYRSIFAEPNISHAALNRFHASRVAQAVFINL